MPVIRTPDNIPDIRTIIWKTVLVSTVLFIPVIRTYIVTPKGVLIPGIHNIFYAGYKNIICSSRRCSYNRHPLYKIYYMYYYFANKYLLMSIVSTLLNVFTFHTQTKNKLPMYTQLLLMIQYQLDI